MTKVVVLTRGLSAIVDLEDYEKVTSMGRWQSRPGSNGVGHYATCDKRANGVRSYFFMHRFILNLGSDDPEVDHIDGDGLNNTKANLRLATRSGNNANRLSWGKSAFKGVSIRQYASGLVYIAQCQVNGNRKYLGTYSSEIEAAIAYDLAAIKEYGQYAKLNFS